MELGLRGRRAAVAAGSAGLGFGAARALADEGARVVLCGRRAERVEAAERTLRDAGGDATGVVADLSTPDGAAGFVAAATEVLGGLDVLVANGGGPPPGTVASTPFEAYGPALESNLLAAVAMCRAVVGPMVDAGWGRIVAVTSTTVREPSPTLLLSNIARTGLTAFCKTLAGEIAGSGVTVNTIQPGGHATERFMSLHGGDMAAALREAPAGSLGDPDDFGALVAMLCSEQARFVTGTSLAVDGGVVRALQ